MPVTKSLADHLAEIHNHMVILLKEAEDLQKAGYTKEAAILRRRVVSLSWELTH